MENKKCNFLDKALDGSSILSGIDNLDSLFSELKWLFSLLKMFISLLAVVSDEGLFFSAIPKTFFIFPNVWDIKFFEAAEICWVSTKREEKKYIIV